jgi:hypothetical protein
MLCHYFNVFYGFECGQVAVLAKGAVGLRMPERGNNSFTVTEILSGFFLAGRNSNNLLIPACEHVAMERNEKQTSLFMLKSAPGNTMVEYVLPGLLVALCSIAAFLAVGGSFQELMQDLRQDMSKSSASTKQQTDLQKAQMGAYILKQTLNSGVATQLPSNIAATMASLNATQAAQQTTSTITTLGANGATQQLSDHIVQLANQWKAEGKITDAQLNVLINLANEGHQLATEEKMFTEALLAGQTDLEVNGQSYSLSVNEALGYNKQMAPDVWGLNPEAANPLLRPFAQAYQNFVQMQSQLDPALSQQISNLAIQISAVDDGLKWSVDDALTGHASQNTMTAENLWQATAAHFQDNINNSPAASSTVAADASSLTNTNSTQICTNGKGQDNGTVCKQVTVATP